MLSGTSFRSVFVFSINLLILFRFPSTFFHLAEASLSAISWLYTLVCAVVNCVQLFIFLVFFRALLERGRIKCTRGKYIKIF